MAQSRFFKTIFCITVLILVSLCYVHQEIEIVRTGFSINKSRKEASFLLDQYRSLVYNLSQLQSPKRIEDTLCVNEITLCMPKLENVQHMARVDLAYKE